MSKQKDHDQPVNTSRVRSLKRDTRPNISTADDVNVDKDNAIESPKESLTAIEPKKPKR